MYRCHRCQDGPITLINVMITSSLHWRCGALYDIPHYHGCKLTFLKNLKTVNETIFLHNFIVKHGVICHGKPELKAYTWKLAPMHYIIFFNVINSWDCVVIQEQICTSSTLTSACHPFHLPHHPPETRPGLEEWLQHNNTHCKHWILSSIWQKKNPFICLPDKAYQR